MQDSTNTGVVPLHQSDNGRAERMISVGFEYDKANDIYIAYPVCHIRSEADCIEWSAEYERFFAPLKRRVDAIFVLDMFLLDPVIGARWGEYRRAIHARFTRYTVRVSSAQPVHTAASSNDRDPPRNYASDVREAIAMINAMRAAGAAYSLL